MVAPRPGDIVSIRWPGDVITLRWPDDASEIKPGGLVRLKLSSIIQIIEQVEPRAVAAPVAPRAQEPPPIDRGRPGNCRDCGAQVFWFRSRKTNKWYVCSTQDRTNFHSKTCPGRKASAAV